MKTQYLSIAKKALSILTVVAAVVVPVSSVAATQKTDKPVIHLTTEQYKELQRLQKDLHARSAEGKNVISNIWTVGTSPTGGTAIITLSLDMKPALKKFFINVVNQHLSVINPAQLKEPQ